MYAKLIFRSARRSARDYLVYILTMTICAALFYGFLSISSRFYQPDIGAEYNYSMLSDGMKMAICGVTLLLLFLIRFANRYMLRSRQKEFALEAVMGMEQRTIARLFFAETLLMGGMAVLLGIGLGAVCSQFVTALLLTSYGQTYHPVWTLFPDTVLWTAGFFLVSFLAVGLFNTRTIRRTPILSMLSAQRENETPLQKSRWMQGVAALYLVLAAARTVQGVRLPPEMALPGSGSGADDGSPALYPVGRQLAGAPAAVYAGSRGGMGQPVAGVSVGRPAVFALRGDLAGQCPAGLAQRPQP